MSEPFRIMFLQFWQKYKLKGMIIIIGVIIAVAASIWGIAHFNAAPGGKISVFWGLVEYTKKQDNVDLSTPSIAAQPSQNKSAIQPAQEIQDQQLQPAPPTQKTGKESPKDPWSHIEQKSEGNQSQNIVTNGNLNIRIDNKNSEK